MKIIKLNAIDSTNTYLKNLLKIEYPADGTIVLANEQLAGRGQRNSSWISKKGESLTFSIFKKYDNLLAEEQFAISMAVALAVKEALTFFGLEDCHIKWPNDILSANRKLCGILIENVLEKNRIKHSVIGIGLNVNETEFDNLPQASSLYRQTGIKYNLDEVFTSLSNAIFEKLKSVEKVPFESLKEAYESHLFRKGKISVFENSAGNRFNGIINGVSNSGELIVQTESATKKFTLKEIKLFY
ncbi:biotin--[acetyl-CoA-carboxylase] ligase [Aequorivita echinoideorum]|uniref:Biotin--[acetyl-CoA-carboxylase] ligase n=1 Tax=Aequorivita echinoideorum TaxID=1549647 RepID=A0ABS5S7A1_9FLAO|nr:biotin--[acetyl-CoA-carboxylase] ligase [Aequorivita echinoideorum]MBT0609073.1 biotin--[acetyl-CoA-carboxylase] ligase [Aequorivita echinoideorum]